ncbi:hypothetical protein IKF92_00450 [Candidatus Saccharibacteria bacterium]|nr:hypothetical protein [Candidatus Saccharibacteria bacterium]
MDNKSNIELAKDRAKKSSKESNGALIVSFINLLIAVVVVKSLISIEQDCGGVISTGCNADDAVIMALLAPIALINEIVIICSTVSAFKGIKNIPAYSAVRTTRSSVRITGWLAICFGATPLLAWIIGVIV